MSKKFKRNASALDRSATKRDIRDFSRKTEAGFEQLVVNLYAAMRLISLGRRFRVDLEGKSAGRKVRRTRRVTNRAHHNRP